MHLKEHEIIHIGEKPFSCTHCNYGFANEMRLKEHEIIHTGEKPFSCTHCNYKFANEVSLKEHDIVHTDENLLVAPIVTTNSQMKCV